MSCLLVVTALTKAQGAGLLVNNLRCEYRFDPQGIDVVKPRLSWVLVSQARGQTQTAYRVLVAASLKALAQDTGDLWDSGRRESDETIQIVYEGKPLHSREAVWWKVSAWDKDGKPSPWSKPAHWTMGLLLPSDWHAEWIADPAAAANPATRGPLNGFHSEFAGRSATTKWVALDLGKPERLDAVRLCPARPYDWQPDTPGFLFPLRFAIELADRPDFSDARVVTDRTGSEQPNPGTKAVVYSFPAQRARFVRLHVTALRRRDGTNYAFALAEMQALRDGVDVAQGAKVAASDSIETGAWAAANLTDGVLRTVPPGGPDGALPATMVRRAFRLSQAVKKATVYVTALGLYELRINGHRVGKRLLAPEWTDYRKRVQYQTYDVTPELRSGENVIGAMLGEGWYAGRLMVVGRFAYGRFPRFLLQLEIELADGTRRVVLSDGSWRGTTDGPIRAAGIYDGELYDASREGAGWDAPGFDEHTWRPVNVYPLDARRLVWQPNEPIEVERELRPAKLTSPRPGVYIFDLGQNMVGWCRLTGWGLRGMPVTIRHGEMLNDDGTLYTANLRGAPQVDRYTPARDGEFTFEPHFTYHGFRYVEVSGLARPPTTHSVVGCVFHSAAPRVARFVCSEPSLNRLMENVVWTERANLMSSPTDCPQRDERFGWMGDIQAFSQTAIFNFDLSAFFSKWLRDVRDDQADDGRFPDFAPHPGNPNTKFSGAPAWADAGVIVPWRVFENYADTRLLGETLDSARRWVDYIHRLNPDLIWANGRNNDYNDWLNGDWIKKAGWPAKGGSVPNEVFATAFFAHSTELVAKMAKRLGRTDEAQECSQLFERIRTAFNRGFVKPDGAIKGDTQGGYALALRFDLLPDALRPKAARRLVESINRYGGHLSTGIQTTHRAMLELVRNGYSGLAWQLLTNRSFPSWLYMLDNGATTIWERWDGYVKGRGFQDPGMNSFNHWALGAVGEWMWRNIAGLNPDDAHPGWKHFIINPQPGGSVTWADGQYDSIRGRIESRWKLEDGVFNLEVTIPANTTAKVGLPAADEAGVSEGGLPIAEAQGVRPAGAADGRFWFELESGRYQFTCPWRTSKGRAK